MATFTVALGHSGSQAQPDNVADEPTPLVPSTRSTAPWGPNRYLAMIALASMSRGHTRPFGHGSEPVLQRASASLMQSMFHPVPGSGPAPQHSGLPLQTRVVHGEQSHGIASPGSCSLCVQWLGENTCRRGVLVDGLAQRLSSM